MRLAENLVLRWLYMDIDAGRGNAEGTELGFGHNGLQTQNLCTVFCQCLAFAELT